MVFKIMGICKQIIIVGCYIPSEGQGKLSDTPNKMSEEREE
jgi:hypothetical protein